MHTLKVERDEMRFNISELKENTKNVNRLDFEKTSLDERMQSVSRLLEDKVQDNFFTLKFAYVHIEETFNRCI